ncbi:MAG TPA: DNA-formamidopyrimidine glycosylase family protein [Acidimicrobiales bacterium]|nr:DNA-formamidopyrimidine glycosylase family protein [Acidimicrobiales bacterium]
MPEGDTIFRAATVMRRWLQGREITAASTAVADLPAHKLVGQTVEGIEARGKHLLLRLSSGQVLHTHMRMTGSWHVYRKGEPWQRPAWQLRIVLECGDRVAACFNAPVVELLAAGMETLHPSLAGLGPDVLVEPVTLDDVRRRARTLDPSTEIGDVLLDQRVVSGIGNIYRAESLFIERVDPFTPLAAIDDATLDRLVLTAARIMGRNARPGAPATRDFERGRSGPWVYGRANRPCYRCRTLIKARRTGNDARTVYWCPSCQSP